MAVEIESPARLQQALDSKLRHTARKRHELTLLESQMNGELQAVKDRYAGRIALCRRTVERLGGQLMELCRCNRSALLPPGRKSIRTGCGVVGYRLVPGSVRYRDGCSDAEVCRRLRQRRLDGLVRTREQPDRTAIRKAWEEGRVDAGRLARCGIVLDGPHEEFYFKVDGDLPIAELTGSSERG